MVCATNNPGTVSGITMEREAEVDDSEENSTVKDPFIKVCMNTRSEELHSSLSAQSCIYKY